MRLADPRAPRVRAAVLGVLAYGVGYLVTYGWFGGRALEMAGDVRATIRYGVGETVTGSTPTLAALLGDGGGAATTWARWLLYSAHFVPFSVDLAERSASGTVPNLLLAADPPTVMLLFAVPPLLLVAAGAVAARDASTVSASLLPAGVRRGMGVAVGYLPLAVTGALVFAVSPALWRRGAVAPDLLASIVVMGFVYPLCFGGLGGALATRFRWSRAAAGSGHPGVE